PDDGAPDWLVPGLDCMAPGVLLVAAPPDGGMGVPGWVADGADCELLPEPDAGGVPLPEPLLWARAGPAISATPTIPAASIVHRSFMLSSSSAEALDLDW